MHPENKKALEQRVARAAEAALAHHQYVTAIDVFTGMGLLAAANVQAWRKGRIDFLERVVQGNLKEISFCMAAFRRWAHAKGLRPSETGYVCRTGGTRDIQFSKSGNPSIEKNYRTHFVSPELAERKRKKLEERAWRSPPQPLASQIPRKSEGSECGAELAESNYSRRRRTKHCRAGQ